MYSIETCLLKTIKSWIIKTIQKHSSVQHLTVNVGLFYPLKYKHGASMISTLHHHKAYAPNLVTLIINRDYVVYHGVGSTSGAG